MLFALAVSAGAKAADMTMPTGGPALNGGCSRHCKRDRAGLLLKSRRRHRTRENKVLRVMEDQQQVHRRQHRPPAADRLLGLDGDRLPRVIVGMQSRFPRIEFWRYPCA